MKVAVSEEQLIRVQSKFIYESILDELVFRLSLLTEDGKTEPDMEWDFTKVEKDIYSSFINKEALERNRGVLAEYRKAQEENIGKAVLARRLGVALPQVDRLLNLKHHSRLDAVERALEVVGRKLQIVVSAA